MGDGQETSPRNTLNLRFLADLQSSVRAPSRLEVSSSVTSAALASRMLERWRSATVHLNLLIPSHLPSPRGSPISSTRHKNADPPSASPTSTRPSVRSTARVSASSGAASRAPTATRVSSRASSPPTSPLRCSVLRAASCSSPRPSKRLQKTTCMVSFGMLSPLPPSHHCSLCYPLALVS